MKTNLIYLASALSFLSLNTIAQHRSIAFEHGTFNEIKAKALKENKLIFIDAYTTWCGPCKQMAKTVFTNDTVADYYNNNLVNAKIDMEKGEGIEIAKLYEVRCYPNLLFIDGNGNLVHRVAGSMSPKQFIELAEEAKNPEKCYSYYSKNYEANKTNSDFLSKYITIRESTCLETDIFVKEYFSLQNENDLASKANWEMIQGHTNNMDSNEFVYLIANKEKFDNSYTATSVNEKINQVFSRSLFSIIRQTPFDEQKYNDTKSRISSFNLPNTKLILFESDLSLASKKKDWALYATLASDNVDLYYSKNADALNNISWTFFESVDDKEALSKAESWSKKACDMEPSYANLDTYAALLFKSGKKQQALEASSKAIAMAKKDKLTAEDYQGTTDLIKKIKALK